MTLFASTLHMLYTSRVFNGYLSTTKEAARWIGEITYTANHRDEPPFRDSVASRAMAIKAKIGRAKAKPPKIVPMIVARPACLGGHDLLPLANRNGAKQSGVMRCSICRQSSAKPRFCMSRCKGSAASKWAEVAKRMADNRVVDGGGHTRMISGDVIWRSTCGAYADLSVSGLQHVCTSRHTGPWEDGGNRQQLSNLKKNRHPKTGNPLPMPIAESFMALEVAATASDIVVSESAHRSARYSAKDKAIARAHADDFSCRTHRREAAVDQQQMR